VRDFIGMGIATAEVFGDGGFFIFGELKSSALVNYSFIRPDLIEDV